MHQNDEEERSYTMAADEEVCECLRVQRHVIEREVAAGACTLVEIGDRCDAGLGCGECHRELGRMVLRHRALPVLLPPDTSPQWVMDSLLLPLTRSCHGDIQVEYNNDEYILYVEGDDALKQSVALWAELLLEQVLPPGVLLTVE